MGMGTQKVFALPQSKLLMRKGKRINHVLIPNSNQIHAVSANIAYKYFLAIVHNMPPKFLLIYNTLLALHPY